MAEKWGFSEPTIDHEMGQHVFGGISSPTCSNYSFKETADNKLMYRLKAADTLKLVSAIFLKLKIHQV